MKGTFIAALLCLALAVAAQAQTKVVNYNYDAAGNRTGRVTVTLPEQQSTPETDQSSFVAPQKLSSVESSANAGKQTTDSSETIGNQTARTPEAMPVKEETPAAVPSEKQEDRQ